MDNIDGVGFDRKATEKSSAVRPPKEYSAEFVDPDFLGANPKDADKRKLRTKSPLPSSSYVRDKYNNKEEGKKRGKERDQITMGRFEQYMDKAEKNEGRPNTISSTRESDTRKPNKNAGKEEEDINKRKTAKAPANNAPGRTNSNPTLSNSLPTIANNGSMVTPPSPHQRLSPAVSVYSRPPLSPHSPHSQPCTPSSAMCWPNEHTRYQSTGHDVGGSLPRTTPESPVGVSISGSSTFQRSKGQGNRPHNIPTDHFPLRSHHSMQQRPLHWSVHAEGDIHRTIPPENSMIEIEQPNHRDVLCGRGATTNKHPGNESFRSLVSLNKERYLTSTKRQKMSISRSIVEAVRSLDPPGRFLEKNHVTGLWADIGNKKAIEKTSQALRDGAAGLRKQLSADFGDPDFLSAAFEDANKSEETHGDKAKDDDTVADKDMDIDKDVDDEIRNVKDNNHADKNEDKDKFADINKAQHHDDAQMTTDNNVNNETEDSGNTQLEINVPEKDKCKPSGEKTELDSGNNKDDIAKPKPSKKGHQRTNCNLQKPVVEKYGLESSACPSSPFVAVYSRPPCSILSPNSQACSPPDAIGWSYSHSHYPSDEYYRRHPGPYITPDGPVGIPMTFPDGRNRPCNIQTDNFQSLPQHNMQQHPLHWSHGPPEYSRGPSSKFPRNSLPPGFHLFSPSGYVQQPLPPQLPPQCIGLPPWSPHSYPDHFSLEYRSPQEYAASVPRPGEWWSASLNEPARCDGRVLAFPANNECTPPSAPLPSAIPVPRSPSPPANVFNRPNTPPLRFVPVAIPRAFSRQLSGYTSRRKRPISADIFSGPRIDENDNQENVDDEPVTIKAKTKSKAKKKLKLKSRRKRLKTNSSNIRTSSKQNESLAIVFDDSAPAPHRKNVEHPLNGENDKSAEESESENSGDNFSLSSLSFECDDQVEKLLEVSEDTLKMPISPCE